MIQIEYPAYHPKIELKDGKENIFDEFRKKWIVLTPEEWVRQNTLQYLTQTLQYPAALIAVEKEIKLGELKKRFDIVVYDKNTKPWMIIECKEMNVPLDKSVLDQVLRYNISLQVPFLVITNGMHCMAFSCNSMDILELKEFPAF